MNIAVIIPSLNPDNKLLDLVNKLIEKGLKNIIVVNDGSSEEYNKIYDKLPKEVRYIKYKNNQGKGYALKTAVKELTSEDAFITVDSDGQHKVSDVLRVAKELENNNLVFGARNFKQKNVPFRSKFGNAFSRLAYFIKTLKRCPDTQTGLRGINIKYKDLFINTKGDRYDFEMNFLCSLKEKIKYIDIETIYEKDNNKKSHFKVIKDSFLIYKNLFIFLLMLIFIIIIWIII